MRELYGVLKVKRSNEKLLYDDTGFLDKVKDDVLRILNPKLFKSFLLAARHMLNVPITRSLTPSSMIH